MANQGQFHAHLGQFLEYPVQFSVHQAQFLAHQVQFPSHRTQYVDPNNLPPPSTSGKRHREMFSGGDARPTKRREITDHDIVFRIVVPSRHIGKVIGKQGCRIQKVREDSKATVKIADAVTRHEDRVIIMSSKDNDGMKCDAEIALQQIACLILKEDDINIESLKVGAGHVTANMIRILIAGSQAGSLIGSSGQSIEKLRNSSGAAITVLAQNQLPLCASSHESDRMVQLKLDSFLRETTLSFTPEIFYRNGEMYVLPSNILKGEVPAVLKALEEIGCQLRENPARQVISVSPAAYSLNNTFRLPQQSLDPTSADYINFEMLISETMVGGLIGRCGSNIARIRAESGAAIKVYGGKGEQKHRQIQFGGSAQQVALAKQRVDEYIYSQLIQQSGGQQFG